jgi:F0F1-type ATP synthase membrane subunit b/b'
MFFWNLPNEIAVILTSFAICLTLIALFIYLRSYIKIMKSRNKNIEETGV